MEYVYATLTLNETGSEINQRNLTSVLEAAGADVVESRVKAIVAALEDLDLAEIGSEAGIAPAPLVDADGEGAEAEPTGEEDGDSSPESSTTAEDGDVEISDDERTIDEQSLADEESVAESFDSDEDSTSDTETSQRVTGDGGTEPRDRAEDAEAPSNESGA